MNPENKYVWQPLQRELDKLGWHKQRLEVVSGIGIPDLNVHVPKFGDHWVELKYVSEASVNIDIGLRPEQYIWLLEGQRAGRLCILLARVSNQWWAWDDAGAWKVARHSTDWTKLQELGYLVNGPVGFLHSIGAGFFARRKRK